MTAFKRIVDIELTEATYGSALVCYCIKTEDGGQLCQCDDGSTILNREYYVGKELRFLPDGSYVICN